MRNRNPDVAAALATHDHDDLRLGMLIPDGKQVACILDRQQVSIEIENGSVIHRLNP